MRYARFAPPAGSPGPAGRVPEGTVVYAIGDIHGRLDLLDPLLAAIQEDSRQRAASRRVLVFLGDYINRGRDSSGVIERLAHLQLPGFATVALKGNNEDAMMGFLEGDLALGAHWIDFGGGTTLADYGLPNVAPSRSAEVLESMRWRADEFDDYGISFPGLEGQDVAALEKLRQDFLAALAGPHLEFLRALKIWHREGDYLFVHAGVLPGVPLEKQSARDAMWIRRRFLDATDDFGAIVVHGHSISAQPEVLANRIGIDTGAYKTGILTALILDGDRLEFLQTG